MNPSSSSFQIHLVYYLEPQKPSVEQFNKIIETTGDKTLQQICSTPEQHTIYSLFCHPHVNCADLYVQDFYRFSNTPLSNFCSDGRLKGSTFTFYLYLYEKIPRSFFRNSFVNNLFIAQLLTHNYNKQKAATNLLNNFKFHDRSDLVVSFLEEVIPFLPKTEGNMKIIERMLKTLEEAKKQQTVDLTQSTENADKIESCEHICEPEQPIQDFPDSIETTESVFPNKLTETKSCSDLETKIQQKLKQLEKHKKFLTKIKSKGFHIRSHYNLRNKNTKNAKNTNKIHFN